MNEFRRNLFRKTATTSVGVSLSSNFLLYHQAFESTQQESVTPTPNGTINRTACATGLANPNSSLLNQFISPV